MTISILLIKFLTILLKRLLRKTHCDKTLVWEKKCNIDYYLQITIEIIKKIKLVNRQQS